MKTCSKKNSIENQATFLDQQKKSGNLVSLSLFFTVFHCFSPFSNHFNQFSPFTTFSMFFNLFEPFSTVFTILHWCYYPQTLIDSVSTVCNIFLRASTHSLKTSFCSLGLVDLIVVLVLCGKHVVVVGLGPLSPGEAVVRAQAVVHWSPRMRLNMNLFCCLFVYVYVTFRLPS